MIVKLAEDAEDGEDINKAAQGLGIDQLALFLEFIFNIHGVSNDFN